MNNPNQGQNHGHEQSHEQQTDDPKNTWSETKPGDFPAFAGDKEKSTKTASSNNPDTPAKHRHPHISPDVIEAVEQREFVPDLDDFSNLGRGLASVCIRLDNPDLPDDERARLEKNKAGWVAGLRKTCRNISENGLFSPSDAPQIAPLHLGAEWLPWMDSYYKSRFGDPLDQGLMLGKIKNLADEKIPFGKGWLLEDGSIAYNYIGILGKEDESGCPVVPDSTFVEFVRRYNLVIAQETREFNEQLPAMFAEFSKGVRNAVTAGALPRSAIAALKRFDVNSVKHECCDPLTASEKLMAGCYQPKKQGNSEPKVRVAAGRKFGAAGEHEWFHAISQGGEYITRLFGNEEGSNINEALTERAAQAVFDEEADGVGSLEYSPARSVYKIKKGEDLERGVYVPDRQALEDLLSRSSDGDTLLTALYDLYFTEKDSLSDDDFSKIKQKIEKLMQ